MYIKMRVEIVANNLIIIIYLLLLVSFILTYCQHSSTDRYNYKHDYHHHHHHHLFEWDKSRKTAHTM